MNDTSLSGHSRAILVMVVLGLLCMTFLLVPVSAGGAGQRLLVYPDKNSVMKGENFSVSVTGRPNTIYWVWIKGTSQMTGFFDDQPPMIPLNQAGVYNNSMSDARFLTFASLVNSAFGAYLPQNKFDPNYVAADTPFYPFNGTQYWAMIKTNANGVRTVGFTTSNQTKARTYTIRVENNTNVMTTATGSSVGGDYKTDEVYVNVGTGTGVPAWVHTISGTIFNHTPGDTIQILVFDQPPYPGLLPIANASLVTGDQYTISVPEGTYWLLAFADLNGNVQSDPDEPSGFALNKTGKHLADPIFVFHDTDNIDITLTTKQGKPAGSGVNLTSDYGKVNAGTNFSLTVQGQPNTVYWLWVKNGTDMPVDPYWQWYQNYRPPLIIPDQIGVFLDNNVTPAVGLEYVPNGSIQTVYDLVPHAFENGSRYYARVRTNESGYVTIPWETSVATKAQPYSFRVENHSVAYSNYTFDEAMVKVLAGSFTLLAPGDSSFYLGDEIRLMGTSTMTDRVYLFITGPNLPWNGAQVQSLNPRGSPVVNNIPSTFESTDVYTDRTWDWRWTTLAVALDPGYYTIYAVSAPLDAGNLNVIYANYTILIKEPFITASVDPPVAVQENWGVAVNLSDDWWETKSLFIRGLATGSPPSGVAMWVLGPNYVTRRSTQVNPDGSYEFALENEDIMSLAPGRYHVIVQHPMQNGMYDITLCAGNYNQVCNLQQASGVWGAQSIFTLLGPGSLTSEEAYQALLDAIGDPANDDIYTKLDFDVVQSGSAPPPANSINVASGWNFISVPKKLAAGSDTASFVFTGVNTGGHTIWEYNSSAGSWHNMTADDPVKPLRGIWIFSDHAMAVPLTFDIPQNPQLPPTRTLYPGWNAIGFTGTVPASAHDMLSSVDSIWSVLIGFDANYGQYTVIHGGGPAFADTRELSMGNGFWVFVSSQGTLAAIG